MTADLQYSDHIDTGLSMRGGNQPHLKTRRWCMIDDDSPFPMGYVYISSEYDTWSNPWVDANVLGSGHQTIEKPVVTASFLQRPPSKNSEMDAIVKGKNAQQKLVCDVYIDEGKIVENVLLHGIRDMESGTVIKVTFNANFKAGKPINEVMYKSRKQ
jgi:hypothetical protein